MKTAKSLAVETLIGVEKGFARWKAMFDDRKKSPIADYMISLNTKPVQYRSPRRSKRSLESSDVAVNAKSRTHQTGLC
ncbi:hypothetical protein ACSF6G_20685 [Escherichia coli]|uniref:hypothetical protein n=1 Tax=Escherichia coli TaxID=562 RepID=UPI003EE91373